jgi:hypothetical protein
MRDWIILNTDGRFYQICGRTKDGTRYWLRIPEGVDPSEITRLQKESGYGTTMWSDAIQMIVERQVDVIEFAFEFDLSLCKLNCWYIWAPVGDCLSELESEELHICKEIGIPWQTK